MSQSHRLPPSGRAPRAVREGRGWRPRPCTPGRASSRCSGAPDGRFSPTATGQAQAVRGEVRGERSRETGRGWGEGGAGPSPPSHEGPGCLGSPEGKRALERLWWGVKEVVECLVRGVEVLVG